MIRSQHKIETLYGKIQNIKISIEILEWNVSLKLEIYVVYYIILQHAGHSHHSFLFQL